MTTEQTSPPTTKKTPLLRYAVQGAIIGILVSVLINHPTNHVQPLTTAKVDAVAADLATKIKTTVDQGLAILKSASKDGTVATAKQFDKKFTTLPTDSTTTVTASATPDLTSWCLQVTDTGAYTASGPYKGYGYYTVIYSNDGIQNQGNQRDANLYSCQKGVVVRNPGYKSAATA